jgi:hypothetical protein
MVSGWPIDLGNEGNLAFVRRGILLQETQFFIALIICYLRSSSSLIGQKNNVRMKL